MWLIYATITKLREKIRFPKFRTHTIPMSFDSSTRFFYLFLPISFKMHPILSRRRSDSLSFISLNQENARELWEVVEILERAGCWLNCDWATLYRLLPKVPPCKVTRRRASLEIRTGGKKLIGVLTSQRTGWNSASLSYSPNFLS